MINQIFWDFDGTLFNTYPNMVAAFRDSLINLGIDEIEIDDNDIYRTMRKSSVGAAIQKFSSQYGINKIFLQNEYTKLEPEYVNSSKPFPGVMDVLKLVLEIGGSNYLLTHRDEQANQLLSNYDLLPYFKDTVTKSQGFKRKPNPESLLHLINKYSINLSAAVMIGDRKLDVEAGNNANISSYLFDPDNLIILMNKQTFRASNFEEIYNKIKNSAI